MAVIADGFEDCVARVNASFSTSMSASRGIHTVGKVQLALIAGCQIVTELAGVHDIVSEGGCVAPGG